MLAEMNAMTDTAGDPWAMAYLRRYGEYSGRVHGPILMAHNIEDPITPVEGVTNYANLVASAGKQELLTPRLLRVAGALQLHRRASAGADRRDGWVVGHRRGAHGGCFPRGARFRPRLRAGSVATGQAE